MSTRAIISDIFLVTAVDSEGKRFKSVSRIEAKSDSFDFRLRLDYNCDIYNLPLGQSFSLAISPITDETLIPSYDYVMSGTVFKEEFEKPDKLVLYASFGGLLMELVGLAPHLEKIVQDDEIYLLIKKI
ncbi:putative Rpb8-PA [Monocercomonoides exilis]|uniref:putative Rpb8-PA n=1 Tax=Monocercomonoides exilis TaxID=2049356 RepID=UPI0035595862|nr:putative Rpb8-PA [Monocercomonoides exilis]